MAIEPDQTTYVRYIKAWDLPTRIFHWVNLLTILILTVLGLVMMYKSDLGISGLDAKIGLKKIHVVIGYVFATNLMLRVIWGFIDSSSARFKPLFIPLASFSQISSYLKSKHQPPQYVGHNPLGKPMVTILFIVLVLMAATGLFRAGTDIYYPPLGSSIQTYLAKADVPPEQLKPYQEEGVDTDKQTSLAPYKKWMGKLHLWGFWLLMVLATLHIAGAIHTESRRQRGIISAMFSGYKPIEGKAADEDN